MRALRPLRLLAPALLLVACDSVTGTSASSTGQGIIRVNGLATEVLVAPDTVQAGAPFTVTVSTFALSTCTTEAGLQASVQGDTARIVPLDRTTTRSGTACRRELRRLPRSMQLTLTRPGETVLQVLGYDADLDDNTLVPTSVKEPIVVR